MAILLSPFCGMAIAKKVLLFHIKRKVLPFCIPQKMLPF
jgi:hypothetical protein